MRRGQRLRQPLGRDAALVRLVLHVTIFGFCSTPILWGGLVHPTSPLAYLHPAYADCACTLLPQRPESVSVAGENVTDMTPRSWTLPICDV